MSVNVLTTIYRHSIGADDRVTRCLILDPPVMPLRAASLRAACLLLLFIAGFVISGRVQFKINLGDGDNVAMHRRVCAQADFIE